MNTIFGAGAVVSNDASVSYGNVKLVDDPFGTGRDRVMSIRMWEGQWQTGGKNGGPPSGLQVHKSLDSALDTVYVAYDIGFSATYIYPMVVKHVGPMSAHHLDPAGESASCRMTVHGRENYFGDVVCATEASGSCYVYDTDRDGARNFYLSLPADTLVSRCNTPGVNYTQHGRLVWHTIEVKCKFNSAPSPGSPGATPLWDGELMLWHNGVRVVNFDDVQYRNAVDPTLQWTRIYMGAYIGGNVIENAAQQTQDFYYDRFIVSENPITHLLSDE